MTNEEKQEEIRTKFYNSPEVIKYIKAHGIPKTHQAFRDIVGSGSSQKLDGAKGTELIATLVQVTFRDHTQQINVMDKMSGKTISTIPR
jgi:hypothetical protein